MEDKNTTTVFEGKTISLDTEGQVLVDGEVSTEFKPEYILIDGDEPKLFGYSTESGNSFIDLNGNTNTIVPEGDINV